MKLFSLGIDSRTIDALGVVCIKSFFPDFQWRRLANKTALNTCAHTLIVASYQAFPHSFFRSRGKNAFFHSCEKSCEGRPGYEATLIAYT